MLYCARQKSHEVRSRLQTILVAADSPVSDREFLGERAIDLCRDVLVFSAQRLNASHNYRNSKQLRSVVRFRSYCCEITGVMLITSVAVAIL